MEKRILIDDNIMVATSKVNEVKRVAEILNDVYHPALEKLGFEFSPQWCNIDALEAEVNRRVAADLKSIKTPSIREAMQKDSDIAFEMFKTEIQGVQLDMKGISFVDGAATVTEQTKDEIREAARYYLTDPADLTTHKKLNDAVAMLNEVIGGLPMSWDFNASHLMKYDSQTKRFILNQINYDLLKR